MNIPRADQSTIQAFQQTPPVDVVALAERFGLKVFADELPHGISGKIVLRPEFNSPSGYSIIVNAKEAPVRQRFTVAHEIAHFILHKDLIGDGISESTLYRANVFSSQQETDANKLAAEILMPWTLLQAAVSEQLRTPAELAVLFNVSEVAMSIRLGLPT